MLRETVEVRCNDADGATMHGIALVGPPGHVFEQQECTCVVDSSTQSCTLTLLPGLPKVERHERLLHHP